jgi:hypothetical protein
MIAASSVSSSSGRFSGRRYAASTNGNVVDAYDESDKVRNDPKEDAGRL